MAGDYIRREVNAEFPVVRCKDCEYLVNTTINANGFLICDISDMEVAPDDFCSYGERRGGGNDNVSG